MGKFQSLVDNMADLAKHNKGFAVIDVWMCVKCHVECYYIHAAEEVVPCGNCGHRHASAFSRYQIAANVQADYEAPAKNVHGVDEFQPPDDKRLNIPGNE